MLRLSFVALVIGLAGCGPAVAEGQPDPSGSSGEAPEGSTSSPGSTTQGPTTTAEPGSTSSSTGSTDTTTGIATTDGESSTGNDLEPVPGECDIWAQDCPAGEKCMAYADDGGIAWNAVACFPIVPDAAGPGEPCEVEVSGTSGFDTCAFGSMCWNVDDDLQGECVPQCGGTPDDASCADSERVCLLGNEGVLALCLQSCVPGSGTCPEGEQCFPFEGGGVCAPGGEDAGVETCDASECSPGTFCVTAEAYGPECEATACCADFCALDDPSCALPQHVCTPVYPSDPPKGFENVGVCILP